MANLDRAKRRLDRIMTRWYSEDPMLLGALCLIEKKADKHQQTMGIDSRSKPPTLRYNPNFVNALSLEQLECVMAGEGFKLLLHHPTSRIMYPKEISSLASSITVDQKIMGDPFNEVKYIMPMPKQYGLEPGSFYEDYFRKLNDKAEQTKEQIKKIWDSMTDQQKQEAIDKAQQQQSDDSKDGDGYKDYKPSGQGGQPDSQQALKDYFDPNGTSNQDWGENSNLDSDIMNYVDQKKSSSGEWGKHSADFQIEIISANEPKISWKEVLRRFNTSMIAMSSVSSRKKVNRRYDLDAPGRRRDYTSKLIVAVDVSGSMGDDDLAEGFAFVNSICRHASVDYLLFDTKIKVIEKKFKHAKKTFSVTGRGGTDYTEVIEYTNNQKADGLIIFTDGDAGKVEKPRSAKVLWLMHSTGQVPPVDWGFVAHMDRNESRF